MIRLLALPVLVVSLAVPAGPQRQSAEGWLASAASAPTRVSFTGTKVVVTWTNRGAAGSTVTIAHRAPNRLRLEYAPTAGRKRRIVIDDGRRRWQYEPTTTRAFLSPSPSTDAEAPPRNHLPLLLKNYTATLETDEYVAGRSAVVVAVRPRTPDRPSLKLWVDRETSVILRSERSHADGSIAQLAAFTEIHYQTPPERLFAFTPPPTVKARRLPWDQPLSIDALARRVRFRPIAPPQFPDGFTLDRAFLSRSHTLPVAVLYYTDGLATLTFSQQKGAEGAQHALDKGMPIAIAAGEGSVRQQGDVTILHWRAHGLDLTLVGDVSAAELARIASTVGIDPSPGLIPRLKFWVRTVFHRLQNAFGRS